MERKFLYHNLCSYPSLISSGANMTACPPDLSSTNLSSLTFYSDLGASLSPTQLLGLSTSMALYMCFFLLGCLSGFYAGEGSCWSQEIGWPRLKHQSRSPPLHLWSFSVLCFCHSFIKFIQHPVCVDYLCICLFVVLFGQAPSESSREELFLLLPSLVAVDNAWSSLAWSCGTPICASDISSFVFSPFYRCQFLCVSVFSLPLLSLINRPVTALGVTLIQ